jgi:hypothetical protein
MAFELGKAFAPGGATARTRRMESSRRRSAIRLRYAERSMEHLRFATVRNF